MTVIMSMRESILPVWESRGVALGVYAMDKSQYMRQWNCSRMMWVVNQILTQCAMNWKTAPHFLQNSHLTPFFLLHSTFGLHFHLFCIHALQNHLEARKVAVPARTRQDMEYCVGLYETWRACM